MIQKYNYSFAASIIENNDSITLTNIKISPSNEELVVPTEVIADKVSDTTYTTEVSGTGISIIVEKHNKEYYIDISNDTKCFSFGGDRLQKMTALFSSLASISSEIEIQNETPNAEIMATSAGRVLSKSGNGLKIEAYWNPSNDKELAIRFNTTGSRTGEWISRVRITGGYVPSSYVIKSANPTGINSSPDFSVPLSYIFNSLKYNIYIPSFSTVTSVSSTNGNTFAFDISPYVSWNSLNYSTSTSCKGVLMYLYLNKNGDKPVPHGKLTITEHIAATGNVNVSLSF